MNEEKVYHGSCFCGAVQLVPIQKHAFSASSAHFWKWGLN